MSVRSKWDNPKFPATGDQVGAFLMLVVAILRLPLACDLLHALIDLGAGMMAWLALREGRHKVTRWKWNSWNRNRRWIPSPVQANQALHLTGAACKAFQGQSSSRRRGR